MSSIIIVLILTLAITTAIAVVVSRIRPPKTVAGGDALCVYFDPESINGENSIDLELVVGPNTKKVTVERIVLERNFAGRVLAQTPDGFRMRAPEPPPDYYAFEPELDELRQKYKHVTAGMVEKEKRRQYADVREAWEDLKANVVIWQGRLTVRHGGSHFLSVPMRTDVAATGAFTFVYSHRTGIMRTTETAVVEYRPRLVAVHG
jgi:hypothetical protein